MDFLTDLFGGDDAPQPPNAIATAAGQTSTNVATGVANAFLNQANQVTPQGNLTYSTDPAQNYNWNDPVTGVTYSIPRFTVTQTPPAAGTQQREVYDANLASKVNLGNAANLSSQQIYQMLQNRPDLMSGAPGTGQMQWLHNDAANNNGVNPVGYAEMGFSGINTAEYLRQNPDVAAWAQATGMRPEDAARQHYQQYGAAEGRTGGAVGGQQRGIGGYGSQQGGFGEVGTQQFGFGGAGDVTRGYGPADNFSADRGRVEESLYGRLNPQLEKDRARVEQQLADQGIRYGSPAYKQAMDDYNRQSTDARLAVTAAGGQEQQRMMDMAAKEAGFQNAAQQQAYEQQLGRGQFANQAQQTLFEQLRSRGQFANEAQAQTYQQALGAGQFANQAQVQDFQQDALRSQFFNAGTAQNLARNKMLYDAQNQARAQHLTEQSAIRNIPLNEINALMSGSQVGAPNWVSTPNSSIATTDVAGLVNQRFAQDMGIYQQNSANMNALIGGILGAGGKIGAAALSDRREKENIERVGTVFAAGDDGKKPLPVYAFEYKKDIDPTGTRHIGPMAQDVEKIDRDAVINRGGRKYLNTTKLGSILKVA